MNRIIVKPGQIPLDVDPLQTERFAHVGLGRFMAAVMGLDSVVVDGLAVTQTSPASMQVNVSAGCILIKASVDATDYGSLTADTRQIMRLGELAADTLLTLTAPGVFGQSINYLIQVTFSEADDTPLVRSYYNAADPSAPLSGPAGAGTTDYTVRRAAAVVNAKAGASAATGSQTTPTADAGCYPLAVVTVSYGATTITSVNISAIGAYPQSPYLLSTLPDVPKNVQSGVWQFAQDTGTANALVLAMTPKALTPPRLILVKGANTNSGATTVTIDGLGPYAVKTPDGVALGAGAIIANALFLLFWDGAQYQLLGYTPPALITNWKNLPIFPEITSSGNWLSISASTGQLVIATGQTWVHRGWNAYSSSNLSLGNRTLTTLANKTYHLRWHPPGYGLATPAASYPSGLFVLKDLADTGYNPSALAEANAAFDSTYDDMLCAVVTTNGSNVPTVTPLKNKAVLAYWSDSTSGIYTNDPVNYSYEGIYTDNIYWARTPTVRSFEGYTYALNPGLQGVNGGIFTNVATLNRYQYVVYFVTDWENNTSLSNLVSRGYISLGA